jgi:hypothetical protein
MLFREIKLFSSETNCSRFSTLRNNMRLILEVLTAMTIKSAVFLDVTPSDLLEVYRRFGGIYFLHLQVEVATQHIFKRSQQINYHHRFHHE